MGGNSLFSNIFQFLRERLGVTAGLMEVDGAEQQHEEEEQEEGDAMEDLEALMLR